jgi:hypothetical protein
MNEPAKGCFLLAESKAITRSERKSCCTDLGVTLSPSPPSLLQEVGDEFNGSCHFIFTQYHTTYEVEDYYIRWAKSAQGKVQLLVYEWRGVVAYYITTDMKSRLVDILTCRVDL